MEQLAFARWFCQFPALTWMVWLRRDIGYRLLHPFKLIIVNGLLFVVAILVTPGNQDARPTDLAIFAVLTFIIGIYQRIRRWCDVNNGATHLSTYIGSSPLDFRWLPSFVRRNRRVARYVEPLFCVGIGFALMPYSRALAEYLLFSAFCLRVFEDSVFERERNRDLDLVDSIIISEQQTQTLEEFEQMRNTPHFHHAPNVPTGSAPDIEAQIKQRKTKGGNGHR